MGATASRADDPATPTTPLLRAAARKPKPPAPPPPPPLISVSEVPPPPSTSPAPAPAGAAAPPEPAAVVLGLSIAGFERVISLAGGRAALSGWTTQDLKQRFVLAATSEARAPLAAVLAARPDGAALVGRANVFLSHAYDYLFLDAVDAAAAWAARQGPASPASGFFFYFDLLVVNQHAQHGVVPFEELRAAFGGSVRNIGNTLALLKWDNPVLLERSWCIFELATTLRLGAPVTVVLPPNDEAAFRAALFGDFDSILRKVCAIDVERARAREPLDQAKIARAVRDMGGFLAVNQCVVGSMRRWVVGAGRAVLDGLPAEERAGSPLLRNFAELLGAQGDYGAALELRKEAAVAAEAAHGKNHPTARLAFGFFLCARDDAEDLQRLYERSAYTGSRNKAVAAFRGAYEGRRASLGDAHEDTLEAAGALAGALSSLARDTPARSDPEALALLRGVHRERVGALGQAHVRTLRAALSLARELIAAGGDRAEDAAGGAALPASALAAREEAIGLFNDTLDVQRITLGQAHPDTLTTQCFFASDLLLVDARAHAATAQELLEGAREGLRRVMGEDHPRSLLVLRELAGLHSHRGDFAGGAALLRERRDIVARRYGEESREAAMATRLLAGYSQKEMERVEEERRAREERDTDEKFLERRRFRDKIVEIRRNAFTTTLRVCKTRPADCLTALVVVAREFVDVCAKPEAVQALRDVIDICRHLVSSDGNEYTRELVDHLLLLSRVLSSSWNSELYGAPATFESAGPIFFKPREAAELALEAFDINRRVLGPVHEDTMGALRVYFAATTWLSYHFFHALALFRLKSRKLDRKRVERGYFSCCFVFNVVVIVVVAALLVFVPVFVPLWLHFHPR